jgi:hypothetical protein
MDQKSWRPLEEKEKGKDKIQWINLEAEGEEVVTPGRCSFDDHTNASPRGSVFQMLSDTFSADEGPILLPLFTLKRRHRQPTPGCALIIKHTDDPGETCLDRARVLVEVVAVQTHPSLEAQAVARAEAGQLDRRFGEQLRDLDRL